MARAPRRTARKKGSGYENGTAGDSDEKRELNVLNFEVFLDLFLEKKGFLLWSYTMEENDNNGSEVKAEEGAENTEKVEKKHKKRQKKTLADLQKQVCGKRVYI